MACDQSEKDWTLHEGELDHDDVIALLEQHFAEMRADSPPEACHVLPLARLSDPAVRFFSLRDRSSDLLGIGALKALGRDHIEVKSMRTAASARGKGVGKTLLSNLLSIAGSAGMTRVSLETGNSSLFTAANRLYTGAGFVRCGPFGDYEDTEFTHFYTRAI